MNTRDYLKIEAKKVGAGETINQSQESLTSQLIKLRTLANMFGLYDASDYVTKRLVTAADNTKESW